MALRTSDYSTLTQKLNEWYNEAGATGVADWTGQMFFDTGETDWQVYNYLALHGVAKFDRIAEGAQLPLATSNEGDSTTATQRRFGGRVGVTKDMRMFERYDQMEEVVKSAVEFAFDQIDQSMADMFTNGFSGTSFTDVYGYTQSNLSVDAVVTFSASHTNNINSTTFRNLIRDSAGTANPALARDPIIKARSDSRTYKDPNGAVRPVILDTLVTSALNEDLAERTVFSSGVQGTPNIDLNPLKSKVSNIITWPRLDTRSDATDTSAYWFMTASRGVKKMFKSPFAQRPLMGEAENVHDSLTWEYPLDSYYVLFVGYPNQAYGSTGAN